MSSTESDRTIGLLCLATRSITRAARGQGWTCTLTSVSLGLNKGNRHAACPCFAPCPGAHADEGRDPLPAALRRTAGDARLAVCAPVDRHHGGRQPRRDARATCSAAAPA